MSGYAHAKNQNDSVVFTKKIAFLLIRGPGSQNQADSKASNSDEDTFIVVKICMPQFFLLLNISAKFQQEWIYLKKVLGQRIFFRNCDAPCKIVVLIKNNIVVQN